MYVLSMYVFLCMVVFIFMYFVRNDKNKGDQSSINHLTHWGQNKMAVIFQTAFSNAFSWIRRYEFRLRCHWSLFLRVQLTIIQHWFRRWLGADQIVRLPTHIRITRPQWVNYADINYLCFIFHVQKHGSYIFLHSVANIKHMTVFSLW